MAKHARLVQHTQSLRDRYHRQAKDRYGVSCNQILNIVLLQKVDDAARVGDFQNEIRQRMRLILMPICAIEDFTRRKIYFDVVAFGDIRSGFGTFENWQADVDGVAKENAGVGTCNDAQRARAFDGNRCMFARRAAAKILSADNDIARLDSFGIVRLDLAEYTFRQFLRNDGDVVTSGDNLVRV